MDFSGLLVMPLAAVITAGWIIGVAIVSDRAPGFRTPFLIAFGLGVLSMEPWRIASWQHAGMFAVMFLTLALWVAGGCLIGALPAALAVAVGAKARRHFGR